MSDSNVSLRISSKNIHLDDGTLAAGVVTCAPGQPLKLELGAVGAADIVLPDSAHVALGRFDPHVHFRETAIPTREEVEEHGPQGADYEALVASIEVANALYSIRSGCLAALKGGVCAVGAMGNTPWGPVGPYRHERIQKHYTEQALFPIVMWPRMEPGAAAIPGHEGKDFGSTFGGSGLTGQTRRDMFELWRGQAVSYHNDQARKDETIVEFKKRIQPDEVLLHHEYFNGDTVLACQAETMALAKEAGLSSLLARHIPTGPALQQILDARSEMPYALPAEVGLDYVYWCRERLLTQQREVALINYRRPAHPSREDQLSLIEITRDAVRGGDAAIFFGTDHAPHAPASKAFKDGLPGAPGTRNIEHSLQFYSELVYKYGYTQHDIDRLASINSAKHMAQFFDFPYEVGTMAEGAMANLAIFDPEAEYSVDEAALAKQLEDPHYHSAMKGEKGLRGRSLFTVANGRVWNVEGAPTPLN
ncbi:hypothetical protein [Pelagicoccus sp. SDUM812005]|uniref:hypothetical protein n=1 Tax=Pelagicoccus sp. SDUM812005 TaxID=3041257 RepID=UPI00280F7C74|nr:hypothetical protein [Pelagicoccus sp. SDUM812005]MDQ8183090.1 hypothetical protein [Pelagicoccus sp. SDUM812005]